ncbi:GNAT family N-acetyltransferase [Nocardia sp. NBC_00416]|uniref:GNAT family N-acetyltransferase n=1 Tax=Nocardia sp. NBC_00416 TaxID=2975991 RepID=UPI002E2154C7
MLFEASRAGDQGYHTPDDIRSVPKLARYVENWGRSGDLGVIGEIGQRSAGAAWLRRFPPEDAGDTYIDADIPELAIAVDSTARGTGLGTALLTRLLAEAARSCSGVCLNVRTDNPAHRLYRRLGFVDIPGSQLTNWAGTTSVNMVLRFHPC